jgi:hypothetical protein
MQLVGYIKAKKVNIKIPSKVNLLGVRTARFNKVNLLSTKTIRSNKINLLSARTVGFSKVNLLNTRTSRLLISIFKALGWLIVNNKNR